jgi:transcriptional regulator with XRE-family HTH domain
MMPESITGDQGDFFDVFSFFVEESGLSANQIEKIVIERANECALYYELSFSRSTVTSVLSGKSRPSSETLYRIARFGLNLPERTCIYLELLRRQAPAINRSWTTQTRIPVVEAPTKQSPDSGELVPVPDWVLHPPEGVTNL